MSLIKIHRLFLIILVNLGFITMLYGQNPPINSQYIEKFWEARWLTKADISPNGYGVYHFRKTFEIEEKSNQFIVHVSADNRYKLFVNGIEVSIGPARGDLQHWRFETVDIAKHLKVGKNAIAAVVWNFGDLKPVAQVSHRTAFILQGDGSKEAILNTDDQWKVWKNQSYSPETSSQQALHTYLVVGPGDVVKGSFYPWGWENNDFDDSEWEPAVMLVIGQTYGRGTDGGWRLVPRKIPFMETKKLDTPILRRSAGIQVPPEFLSGNEVLEIPPNTKVTLLLDQEKLTIGYPKLTVSGGTESEIILTYAEGLFEKNTEKKGNRNKIEGKEIRGYTDVFYPEGGDNRTYSTLWNRTWRYLQLDVITKDDPLVINELNSDFSAYPFEENASFKSDLPWLENVWEVGWRTARLCAGETYFDCPYYEQMQYVGDTRIQALISLYVDGDDRLMRRAIDDFDQSRVWNGLTESRYPSSKLQIIPPYSLFWISMIHDHWMHVGDRTYVEELLPGVESVLGWYERQLNDQGLLGDMKWWHFTDWADEWPWNEEDRIGGVPAMDKEGNSSVLAFQYAYALDYASSLFAAMDETDKSLFYANQKKELLESINKYCWDENKRLFRDTPNQEIYSQHANILAILTDAIPADEQKELLMKVLENESLIQATFYFKFYLFRALVKTGMADSYVAQIEPWKNMLDMGLTTFSEKPDPTRSDCHAWSASPNYDLLAIMAGIKPESPGFETVKIEPFLGELKELEAMMPHSKGEISVNYKIKNGKLKANIILPKETEGTFHWQGGVYELKSGDNDFNLK